jgi:hypothetical protein
VQPVLGGGAGKTAPFENVPASCAHKRIVVNNQNTHKSPAVIIKPYKISGLIIS